MTISCLEWFGGLYLDSSVDRKVEIEKGIPFLEGGRVVVNSECIFSLFYEGGKKRRKGPKFKAGVFCEEDPFLDFPDRNLSIQQLWETGRYLDVRPVKVNKKVSIMRSRPIFPDWKLNFSLTYDTSIISKEDIYDSLEIASKELGFLDYRPRFGRFTITQFE